MRISAIEEYGLRCLLALARKGPDEQMTIPQLAEEEGMSIAYVSKLLWTLRRTGLIKAERGRSGGFSIARSPEDISLHESLTALGGPLVDEAYCRKYSGRLERCVHTGKCSIHHILGGLSGFIHAVLSSTTLQDLLTDTRRNIIDGALVKAAINTAASREEASTLEMQQRN